MYVYIIYCKLYIYGKWDTHIYIYFQWGSEWDTIFCQVCSSHLHRLGREMTQEAASLGLPHTGDGPKMWGKSFQWCAFMLLIFQYLVEYVSTHI